MSDRIRVLIADDHPVVRQGLALMLAAEAGIEVVGEAADGAEAVAKALELLPDVVLMDLKMPVKDGVAAIREIGQAQPAVKSLVLAGSATDEEVLGAIRAGARGFLLKDAAPDQVSEAIRAVHRGTTVLDAALSRRLYEEKAARGGATSVETLTPRELDVLRQLARGLSNREIAANLSLTEHTVMTHVRNVLRKLHLANRTQAALYARDHGIL